MAFAVICATAEPSSGASGQRTATCSHMGDPQVAGKHYGRRAVLGGLVVSGLVVFADEARADRTGKYSTKLTARRRYLPRINRAFEALKSVKIENGVLGEITVDQSDLIPAMKLFGSSYYAEGNRIGATEKSLMEITERMDKHLSQLKKAGSGERGIETYQLVLKDLLEYEAVGKLDEISIPS